VKFAVLLLGPIWLSALVIFAGFAFFGAGRSGSASAKTCNVARASFWG
jgi:hypothetical protein